MSAWHTLKAALQNITFSSVRKKISAPQLWTAAGILTVCVILILLALYLKRERAKEYPSQSSPQSFSNILSEQIDATDQIILHQFSKLSITEDHYLLKQFQTKDNFTEWNYQVITVTLPSSITLNQVENVFNRGFSFFEPEGLTWSFSYTSENCLKIDVCIHSLKTHQLLFCYPISTSDQTLLGKDRYRVSIIIDDLGEDYAAFKKLLSMDYPFTYSVLPFQTHSIRIAEKAYRNNQEVILHLPLEPKNSFNHSISSSTLLTTMDKDTLLDQLEKNLNAVPHISGVSNHMGSQFTEHSDKMKVVLEKIKTEGLYFLDSRTTKDTVGYTLAKEMGIRTAERDLFIDNNKEPSSIEKQLNRLPLYAKKNGGYAIAIGHPHATTIEALKNTLPLLEKQGVVIVPLSQLIN